MTQPAWRGERSLLTLIAVVLAAGLAAAPVHAQSLYGTIVGTVTDAQGATIPGATVTITNENTGLAMSTVTEKIGWSLV